MSEGVAVSMDGSIHTGEAPEHAKGKWISHQVSDCNDEKEKKFTLIFQKKAMDADSEGSDFTSFEENASDPSLEEIAMAQVKEGQKRHCHVTTHAKHAEEDKRMK